MIKKKSTYYMIVFLLIILVVFNQIIFSEEVNKRSVDDVHFYFAQITDTHFGIKNNLKWAKKIVEVINDLPIEIEFVVHTGDITQEKIEDDKLFRKAESIFRKIKSPIHFIPGNHDILPNKLEITVDSYKRHFGNLSAQAEYKGVVFLFVYEYSFARSFFINGYSPLKWIESSLKRAKGKPIVIFQHSSPFDKFDKKGFYDGWAEEKRKIWKRIVNSYNVKAIIAGHYHRDSFHWLGDIPVYEAPAAGEFPGKRPTFRVYEYKNGKIGYWTQYLDPKKNIIQRLRDKLKK